MLLDVQYTNPKENRGGKRTGIFVRGESQGRKEKPQDILARKKEKKNTTRVWRELPWARGSARLSAEPVRNRPSAHTRPLPVSRPSSGQRMGCEILADLSFRFRRRLKLFASGNS